MDDVFSGLNVISFYGNTDGNTTTYHVPTSFSRSCPSLLFLTTYRYRAFTTDNSSHHGLAGLGGIVEGSANRV